jgi:hypothetical protein
MLTPIGQRFFAEHMPPARSARADVIEVQRRGRADDRGVRFGLIQQVVEVCEAPRIGGEFSSQRFDGIRLCIKQRNGMASSVGSQAFDVHSPHPAAAEDDELEW